MQRLVKMTTKVTAKARQNTKPLRPQTSMGAKKERRLHEMLDGGDFAPEPFLDCLKLVGPTFTPMNDRIACGTVVPTV